MRRYAVLYAMFIIQRLKILLEYRTSFLIGASSTLVEQGARLLTLWVIMRQVPGLAGWSLDAVLLVYGFALTARSLEHTFANNLWTVGRVYIRSGEFDRFLVRPINPLFHLLADRFNHDGLGNMLIGLIVIVKASIGLDLVWTPPMILYALASLICGGMIFIALNLITATSAFWIIDSTPVTRAVFELHEFAKYPLGIYSKFIQTTLTWIIPYGFASFYPVSALLGHDVDAFAWLIPVVAVSISFIAYGIWQFGLRHYGGTGS